MTHLILNLLSNTDLVNHLWRYPFHSNNCKSILLCLHQMQTSNFDTSTVDEMLPALAELAASDGANGCQRGKAGEIGLPRKNTTFESRMLINRIVNHTTGSQTLFCWKYVCLGS